MRDNIRSELRPLFLLFFPDGTPRRAVDKVKRGMNRFHVPDLLPRTQNADLG